MSDTSSTVDMVAGSIGVILSAKVQDFLNGMNQSSQALNGFLTRMSDVTTSLTAMGTGLELSMSRPIRQFAQNAIRSYAAYEEQINRLKAALRASNQQVEGTIDTYERFAESIQAVTTLDKEQILTMLTFATTLGVKKDSIENTVLAAIGLSNRYRRDAMMTLRLLIRASDGSTQGLSRLDAQIRGKNLNSQSAYNKMIKDGLQYFSMEKDKVNTVNGSLARMNNFVFELKEGIGGLIVKQFDLVGMINRWRERIVALTRYIEEMNPVLRAMVIGILAVGAAVGPVILKLGLFAAAIVNMNRLMQITALQNFFGVLSAGIRSLARANVTLRAFSLLPPWALQVSPSALATSARNAAMIWAVEFRKKVAAYGLFTSVMTGVSSAAMTRAGAGFWITNIKRDLAALGSYALGIGGRLMIVGGMIMAPFRALGGWVVKLAGFFRPLATIGALLYVIAQAFASCFGTGDTFTERATSGFALIKGSALDTVTSIGSWWKDMSTTLAMTWDIVIARLLGNLNGAHAFWVAIFQDFVTVILWFKDTCNSLFTWWGENWGAVWTNAANFYKTIWNNIVDNAGIFLENIKRWWRNLQASIKGSDARETYESGRSLLEGYQPKALTEFKAPELKSNLVNPVNAFWEAFNKYAGDDKIAGIIAKFFKPFIKARPNTPAATTTGTPSTQEYKLSPTAIAGSVEALRSQFGGGSIMVKIEQNTKRQADIAQDTNDLLAGGAGMMEGEFKQ